MPWEINTIEAPKPNTTFEAAVVRDERPGINLTHLMVEPPFHSAFSDAVAEALYGRSVEITGAGYTQVTIDHLRVFQTDEEISEKFKRIMGELSCSIVPFKGLPEDATREEFFKLQSDRDWEAKEAA